MKEKLVIVQKYFLLINKLEEKMNRCLHSKENFKRIKNWLMDYKVRIFLILLLYPNLVCFTPDSTGTSETFVDFMLGLGML